MQYCALLLCVLPPQNAPEPRADVVLEGRVVDLRGEGVRMAKVQVTTREQPDQVLAESACDGEGWFRVGHLAPLPGFLVQAQQPGMCTAAASVSPSSPFVTVQLHDATTVRGVLRDRAGRPVPDAIVRAELVARILHDLRCDARTDDH